MTTILDKQKPEDIIFNATKDLPGSDDITDNTPAITDDNRKSADFGISVSVAIVETVTLGNESFSGEAEPRFDPAYDRQSIKLKKKGSEFVNITPFSFESSYDWPGPVIGYIAHDPHGKAVARHLFPNPIDHIAGMALEVDAGETLFKQIESTTD